VTEQTSPDTGDEADGPEPVDADIVDTDAGDRMADAEAALDEVKRRLAEAPIEGLVANHAMGLYELGAIHLSADQPDLHAAQLAIDAMACLVDGLGDRLGENAATMRDALGNIRLAFVRIKQRQASAAANGAAQPGVSSEA
jgi:hypothetical protein